MKYTLSTAYRWIDTNYETMIVKMYFIQDIPYTFDELPEIAQNDPMIILDATASHKYTDEELYHHSNYLIQEEAHPFLFDLDLENPELLPLD